MKIYGYKEPEPCKGCSSQTSPLCGAHESCFPEVEEQCEPEVFSTSDIRYQIGCQTNSITRAPFLEKGMTLDFILQDIYYKLNDIEYVQVPKVPGKPIINSFQAIVADLYQLIKLQKEEIESLKLKINEL